MSGYTPVPGAAKRRYCTMDEAAEVLAVSRDTIRRLIRSGDLEAVKLGRSVRVSLASLDAAGKPLKIAGAR